MIVYRCVSEREIGNLLGISEKQWAAKGENTFKYEDNVDYKHFFYHFDSAISFMDGQNFNRYYDKLTVIMAYDIDDEILKKHFGLGKYNLSELPNKLKDYLLQSFKTIYYPEFAIPRTLITNGMIVGIGDKKRITPMGYLYDDIYDCITNSKQNFLEYEKWLFENQTNVSKDLVLENFELLFPIGDYNKVKKKI